MRTRPFATGETVRLRESAGDSHPLVKRDRRLLDVLWTIQEVQDDGTHFLRENDGDEGICVYADEIERLPGK